MSNSIDIHFTKLPTAEQLIAKATGMVKRSKTSLSQIGLSFRNEAIELSKDKKSKLWSGKGEVAGVTADQIITELNRIK